MSLVATQDVEEIEHPGGSEYAQTKACLKGLLGSSSIMQRWLLIPFDLLKRLIQPAYVGLLKFNSETDNRTKVGILFVFNRIRVRSLVSLRQRAACWKKECMLPICLQAQLMRDYARGQVVRQVIRRGRGAKELRVGDPGVAAALPPTAFGVLTLLSARKWRTPFTGRVLSSFKADNPPSDAYG